MACDPDTGLTPLDHHRPRWLAPEFARIHLGSLGTLHVTVRNEGIYHGVHVVRCFPVQFPDKFLSLRYTDSRNREREIGIIHDLSEWPEEPRRLVQEALRRRYFVHTITQVRGIRQIRGYLEMRVQTDLGERCFIMRADAESAQAYGHGGKILLDMEENRYLLSSIEALPEADRRLFERHIH